MAMKTCSIAIDARNLMHPLGGSGSYIIAALNELSLLKPEWQFILLTNRPLHAACAERIVWRDNVKHLVDSITRVGLLWYSTQLYFVLRKLTPDFFWAPATLLPPSIPEGIKTIVTVNDFVAKDYRATMSTMNRFYSDIMFDRSIISADILLAISKYTAREIEARYPSRKSMQIDVGCGIDQSVFKPLDLTGKEHEQVAAKYGVTLPFLLFVGTLEPRKNLDFMMKLMPDLAMKGYSLLVVGAKGWGKSRLTEIIKSDVFQADKVIFAGYVPTDDLVRLYNAAAVYISTSLNEGFGLPQLEAMNCGCPVVSPHNSAMVEVVEGAGIVVKGWDTGSWSSAIVDAVARREQFRVLGLSRAKDYRWHQVAASIAERIAAS